jgi:aspartokinase/homoserine dehydrogenase 1
MIIQASSEHSICLAVTPDSADNAKELIDDEFKLEIKAGLIDPTIIEKGYSIIAVVGENMRKTLGIAGSLFASLGRNGVNVVTIAQGSSELNISVVVSQKDETKALNAIHEAFFMPDEKYVNLFIMGAGNIGATLLEQIRKVNLKKTTNPKIRVVGLARSKKMYFNEHGIDLQNWNSELEKSSLETSIGGFLFKMIEMDLPYSIFVDNTANFEIPGVYKEIVKNSISIVTPNKIFNVGNYTDYNELRELLKKYKIYFFYETTVGAGLPVINTLRDLINSGDSILKIEGILSGTMSYIFNTFDGSCKFSDVVKDAMKKGFTEPDPRLDLNCLDIARKILTLSREIGSKLELKDVKIEKIVPDECFKVESTGEFLVKLEKYNDYFFNLVNSASKEGKVLRYIASYENGDAVIGLKAVDISHAFYSLQGSDNIIAFTTNRYQNTPLVVRGTGAGAEVTAAGVLADIIKTSNLILKD